MKRKEGVAVLMAIFPLLFGTVIYVVLRPDTYISVMIRTALHINAAPADSLCGVFADFLRFYMSDMLWAFALPSALFAVMGFEEGELLHIFFISVAFAGFLEILQYIGVMSGTGDLVDFILESIAASAAVFILKVVFGGKFMKRTIKILSVILVIIAFGLMAVGSGSDSTEKAKEPQPSEGTMAEAASIAETEAKAAKTEAASEKIADNREKKNPDFTSDDFEVTGEYLYENDYATVYFLGIKNNSEATVEVTGNAVAKDEAGNMLGAKTGGIDVLGPGEESLIYYYLSDVHGVDSVEYTLDYKKESYYYPVIKNLKTEMSLNDRNVTVQVNNTGEVNAQFVEAYALFLDQDEKVLNYAETYITDNDSEIKVGAAQSAQLDCYEDYDHVRLFYTGRSDGTATEASVSEIPGDAFEVTEYLCEDSFSTSYYVIVKNNSEKIAVVTGNATAYDKDGNTLGADDAGIDVIGPGEESITYFYFSDVKGVDHVEYSLSYSADCYYQPVIANLEVEKTVNDSNVVVSITNNGEYPAQFVEAYALFFDAEKNLINYNSKYFTDDDSELKPGASLVEQIDAYSDFESVEVYLTGRYYK